MMVSESESSLDQNLTSKKIGYLIGQFPGPSHTYFWRELQAIRRLGVSVNLISTQLPKTTLASHVWVTEAINQTEYLIPLSFELLLGGIIIFFRAGLVRWLNCIRVIIQADGATVSEKLRLVGLGYIGSNLAYFALKNKLSHIHVGLCADAANIALFAKLLADIPYSLTLHSALEDFGPNQRQKWAHAAFGIAVSKNLAVNLKQSLGNDTPNSLFIVPMGVDSQEFCRRQIYIPWNSNVGPVRIFCAARLTPRKGQQDLIKAVFHLRALGIEVSLKLAGEDMGSTQWFTQNLNDLIASFELIENVELLGVISEDEIRNQLQRAHIFVLPSYAEGMSVAVMEAMAMGVPVLTTNVDGLPDLIEDGVDGLLIPPGKPDLLAQKLLYLMNHPELAIQFSQRGRQKIVDNFSSDRSARILVENIFDIR